MKIDVHQISPDGLTLTEELDAQALDLGMDVVTALDPIKVTAELYRVINAVTARVSVATRLRGTCSRCVEDFVIEVNKTFDLNYPLEKTTSAIDLDPDIREEIILDMPLQPLCGPECKGLCQKCGKNKNEGGCTCGST